MTEVHCTVFNTSTNITQCEGHELHDVNKVHSKEGTYSSRAHINIIMKNYVNNHILYD